jgi:hypothetical protein
MDDAAGGYRYRLGRTRQRAGQRADQRIVGVRRLFLVRRLRDADDIAGML